MKMTQKIKNVFQLVSFCQLLDHTLLSPYSTTHWLATQHKHTENRQYESQCHREITQILKQTIFHLFTMGVM